MTITSALTSAMDDLDRALRRAAGSGRDLRRRDRLPAGDRPWSAGRLAIGLDGEEGEPALARQALLEPAPACCRHIDRGVTSFGHARYHLPRPTRFPPVSPFVEDTEASRCLPMGFASPDLTRAPMAMPVTRDVRVRHTALT